MSNCIYVNKIINSDTFKQNNDILQKTVLLDMLCSDICPYRNQCNKKPDKKFFDELFENDLKNWADIKDLDVE